MFAYAVLSSCGSKVESGRNVSYEETRPAEGDAFFDPDENDGDPAPTDSDPDADGPTGPASPDDPHAPPAGGGDTGGGSSPLRCFGRSPELPSYLDSFCESAEPDKRELFATAYEHICQQKMLVNLFRGSCSWTGGDDQSKFFRVLERTDLDDTSIPEFYFLGAFSTTLRSTPEETIELLYFQFENVAAFEQDFAHLKNSHYYNIEVDRDAGVIEYNLDLATSSSVASFRARLEIVQVTPQLTVAYVWATDDMTLVKDHYHIVFYVKLSDGQTRLVAIDEKVILDSGNHSIAYSTVLSVLRQRMEMAYANSLRD